MKSYKQLTIILVVTVIAISLWSPYGFGYGDKDVEFNTLRGIGINNVVVDWKGSGIEDGELISDKETIKKIVEQRLRQNNINVHCVDIHENEPFLYIEIHSYMYGNDMHTLHVVAKVMQKVLLKEKESISFTSSTWSSEGQVCPVSAESLGKAILKQVDKFVSAYLSVNPSGIGYTDGQKVKETQAKPYGTASQEDLITVDELIKKHSEAIRYDKMRTVNTMKFRGRMIQSRGNDEIETPYTLILKRPGYSRFEFSVQGMSIVMAYDGSTVWQINPLRFRGSPEPRVMDATEAKQIIIDAQLFPAFSSPLIEYKKRGHTVELLGIENINGSKVYKLMATLKFGMGTYWYISCKDYLVPGFTWLAGQHDFGAQGFDVHVRLKEYKKSNGIIFPHVIEDKVAGFTAKKYTVDHAEINAEIDGSIFRMPKKSGS